MSNPTEIYIITEEWKSHSSDDGSDVLGAYTTLEKAREVFEKLFNNQLAEYNEEHGEGEFEIKKTDKSFTLNYSDYYEYIQVDIIVRNLES